MLKVPVWQGTGKPFTRRTTRQLVNLSSHALLLINGKTHRPGSANSPGSCFGKQTS